MLILKKALCFSIFVFLLVGASSAIAFEHKNTPRPISMASARLLSLQEFDKKTGGKIKEFKCKLIEESDKEWIFVFDEYANPSPPGGNDLTVFVNKKTGKTESLFGK